MPGKNELDALLAMRATTCRPTIVEGASGSGKTERLVHRAATLLERGVDPKQILVLCATSPAAADFARRLGKTLPQSKSKTGIVVTTPKACALEVLRAHTENRPQPRELLPFEAAMVMGDAQPLGIRPERLGEMMRFFERSWSDLAHHADGWLVTQEERALVELLDSCQATTGGIMPARIVPGALDALCASSNLLQEFERPYVLMDDAQTMGRASQTLARLLAQRELVVATNPQAPVAVGDPYPCAEGVSEILAAYPQAERLHLTRSAEPATPQLTAHPNASEEFIAVARTIRKAIDDGMSPDGICVVAPHPTWRANIAIALAHEGISAATVPPTHAFEGDARNPGTCTCARALTLLRLVADPMDDVAWRSWCGFGDYFLRAQDTAAVRSSAERHSMGFGEALELLVSNTEQGVEPAAGVIDTYRTGCDLIARIRDGARGRDLIARVAGCAAITPESATQAEKALLELCQPMPDDDAAALAHRAAQALANPDFVGAPHSVRLCSLEQSWGLSPAVTVLAGCMEGFLPSSEAFDETGCAPTVRERLARAQTCMAQGIVARSRIKAHATYTSELPLHDADRLGAMVGRIRLKNGTRMAVMRPSSIFA